MDNLDQLSDDELRLRLVQCGLPVLPVTSTTRKILIKKLRHFIDGEKQKLRRDTSKATRYSSGEESDSNDGLKRTAAQRKSLAASNSSSSNSVSPAGSFRVGRSQRATVAGALPSLVANSMSMPPPPAAPAASVRPASIKRLPNSSISSTPPAASSPFDGANGSSGNNSLNRRGVETGHRPSSTGSKIFISPVIVHDSEDEDYSSTLLRTGSIRNFGNISPTAAASHSSLFRKTASLAGNITPPSANSSMYSNLNNSPLGGGGGGSSNNSSSAAGLLNDSNGSSNGAPEPSPSSSSASSPYISEYTKRLMQLRGETVSQENYNSAISGIIGRRGAGGSTGAIPPPPMSLSSRYSGVSNAQFASRVSQPAGGNHSAGGTGLLHHPAHPLRFSKPGVPGGGPVNPASPLATSIIAGNHIRQRYSRLQPAGGGTGTGGQYEFNENDIVTHAQPSPDPPTIPFRAAIGNFISKLDEHYGFKQTFIPCALLCLLVAFLLSVAFMYMTISTDLASTLSSIDTRYELCGGDGDGESYGTGSMGGGTACVQPGDVEPALELLKLVGKELKTRVEQHHCQRRDGSSSGTGGWMSAAEVLKYAKEHSPSVLIPQLSRHLHAMEYLIDRNPHWRIDHCDADGQPITFAEVLDRRATRSNHFTILRPKLPFTCMLYNKFQKFFVVVGSLALAGMIALAGNYLFKVVIQVKQKRQEQVNRLISEIIHAVSQAAANASDDKEKDARVVIAHLRERVLGTENRRKLSWAWDDALKFIEHNESRIQFEVGTIGGEDFKMMRWIDSAPLATGSASIGRGAMGAVGGGGGGGAGGAASNGSCAKKWQSPAFDNSNKIHDPPTPCLKIRQMFDKYEVNDPNLKTIVQDAILEKVGSRCKIYDIQLDRTSCCVYVRCATAKDAGIVHDEINGWWFDNRLVSIKFLRLERYLQRFPRSSTGPACLKPSNKNNSSMSHQLALQNPAAAGRNSNDRSSAAGGRGKLTNHELDTDPEEEDDEPEEEEEEDEEDEVEEELVVAAAAMGARSAGSGNNTTVMSGRRSGSVLNGRQSLAGGYANGPGDNGRYEDQEN